MTTYTTKHDLRNALIDHVGAWAASETGATKDHLVGALTRALWADGVRDEDGLNEADWPAHLSAILEGTASSDTPASAAHRAAVESGAGGLVASANDRGCVTVRAIPDFAAEALANRLRGRGIEVSTAPDNDDRALSWVYVDVSPDDL